MDNGLFPNPYTGLNTPRLVQKVDMVAETGLPMSKTLDWVNLTFQDNIPVPDDAWADWDAKTQTFITAKDRAAADSNYKQTAKLQMTVTFNPDLLKSKWHDGSTMSVADFVMGIILTFDPGKKDSKIYDEGYDTSTFQAFMSHFKGVKIDSTDPLTITTWDDKFNLDAENSVQTWYPSAYGDGSGAAYAYGTGAWHNLTPGVQAESDGKMAFSLDKSSGLKVDETSLISGPTLAIESTYLDQDATDGFIPYEATMKNYVTADEAKARYANLQAFYKAHNHMWIGTGPYFVDKVDATAGSITLVPFKDYMFDIGPYASAFAEPEIATASVDGPTQVKAGEAASFTVSVTFQDQPYPSKDIEQVGYTVFDASGNAVATGQATMTQEGEYTIDLGADATGKFTAGPASLNVAVASKTVSLPTFVNYQFVVTQ
jgi:peptide/nickel transport system substrate-binding protein